MESSRRRVLVVDDEPFNRELVVACLASTYDVREAPDGRAAIELIEREPIDLILLDVMMPTMNGFDTCRAIKARPGGPFLPVVLLTALNSQDDRNGGLAAGADEFLSKPIDTRELTLRVQALLKLREQDQMIRAQVAELHTTKALIHAQLDQLQELGELKDDLFSLIIHDLRNPLTGVLGFLDLLQFGLRDPDHARLRKHADRAREAADKLHSLLEEVLEVRGLEAGAVLLKKAPVRPLEITREAARTLEGGAATRSIEIAVTGVEELVCSLDPGLVRRSVENLLANAIKFSPSGGRISASARGEHGLLLIEVADEGPGIAEAGKLTLFKKFSTGAPAAAGGRRGFGLGLHLVKLVATAHQGEVIVRDRPGGGSIFGMSIPIGTGV